VNTHTGPRDCSYRGNQYEIQLYVSVPFLCQMVLGPVLVGPCHHGMARPQVADRGTASDKEGSCEEIE